MTATKITAGTPRTPSEAQPLEATRAQALEEIGACAQLEQLAELQRKYLGKSGVLAGWLARLPTLPPAERPQLGQAVNRLKKELTEQIAARESALEKAALERNLGGSFDPTLPPRLEERGTLHPITQVTREIEDLFVSMGYQIADGPEIETDWHNFEALNIPPDHPARDSQDTFYLRGAGRLVLRTHTSPVQVRAMERLKPPLRVIAPGKVFRNEATDASHEHTFHQLEGLVVDKGVSVAHLVSSMKTLLRGIFRRDLEIRLRPGFFPFVEPGFELDARCPFCTSGCSVCKQTRWIELLPCGLVHPNVLRHSGVDPDEWSGFAFGLGLSRLVMLRFGINDVRLLLSSDLRFLEQF
ncbi:MAG TPA: phenylalanine--tRNA ligase subunit alpha [Polyangiaceae bacterium]|nr:phenylalanine--tRNA ligase subunit alpha [Polyangiaceae bacterium]